MHVDTLFYHATPALLILIGVEAIYMIKMHRHDNKDMLSTLCLVLGRIPVSAMITTLIIAACKNITASSHTIIKSAIVIITLFFFNLNLCAQADKLSKTRFVTGLSAPELLHAGVTYRIANVSQIGLNAGVGPSSGTIWTSISLEHRLYLGKNDERINQKTWFFRQGTTFFPSAKSPQQFTLNLTVGKDILFKNIKNGITIDAGVFYLPGSERSSIILVRSLNLWPALRFEFYF